MSDQKTTELLGQVRALLQVQEDATIYGVGFMLVRPDGSMERIAPKQVMIKTETTPAPEWRDGSFGAVVVRSYTETEIWAARSGDTTTLWISESGRPPRSFSMPNAMADRLAASLKGESANVG
jgi:hypothetical protein